MLPSEAIPSRLSNGYGLVDLDTPTLLTIFKHLTVDELLSMAETNNRFRNLIARHYMIPVFHINERVIRLDYANDQHSDSSELHFDNYTAILKLLKNYGYLIRKLVYVRPPSPFDEVDVEKMALSYEKSVEISRNIAKYCRDSLTEITVSLDEYYLLSETSHIFPNVIRVNIIQLYSNQLPPWQFNGFKVQTIFPNIQELHLTPNAIQPMEQFYPQMKHLKYSENQGAFAGKLVHLLRLNPQLNSLALNYFPEANILHSANEILPQLEALKLTLNNGNALESYQNQGVHFENVKRFTLSVYARDIDEMKFPITFKHLEMLEVISKYSTEIAFKLIEQNDKLIELSMAHNDLYALDALNQWNELRRVTLQWSKHIDVNETQRLIGKAKKLNRITFIVPYQSMGDDLIAILSDEWQFVRQDFSRTYLTFERNVVA